MRPASGVHEDVITNGTTIRHARPSEFVLQGYENRLTEDLQDKQNIIDA